MPELDPARRAVVTGLGAVMPIGNDFPTYWSNLVAGVTGTREVRRFDASGVRGADRGRGPRLRPDDRDGRQDGAPDEPVHPVRDGRRQGGGRAIPGSTSRRWTRTSATGSASSSTPAAAASSRSSTAPTSTTRRARASSSPFAVPALSGSMARLHAVDGVRADRSGHHPGRRLRDLGHRLPRRAAADPRRRVRRRPGRRLGGADLADGPGRAGQHGRPVQAQRRPGDGLAAVRRHARRVRPRRGRRGGRRRVARTRPRARRDAAGRGHRRGPDRRRVPHQRARPDRPRPEPGDDLGPAQRRASRRTRSTTSSPTAPRPSSTT